MNNSKKTKFLSKTIATMVLFAMVFQFVPNIVMAIDEKLQETNNEVSKIVEPPIPQISEEEKEPVVIGEIEGDRTLNEKHFLMSDGTIVASIFASNIHYEKDGKLLDINNTLEEVKDTKESLKVSGLEIDQAKDVDSLKQENTVDTTNQEDSAGTDALDSVQNTDDILLQDNNAEINNTLIQDNNIETNNLDEIQVVNLQNIGNVSQAERLAEAENKKETEVYKNVSGNAKVNFTNKTNGYNLGSMESNGYTITWGLLNSRASNVEVSDSAAKANKIKGVKAEDIQINIPQTTIKYEDILANTNIEYSTEPEHVKENIVLQNKEAIKNELKFIYDVGSLKMKLLDSKDIIVYAGTEDNVIFTIQAPFMYDGNLDFNNNIELKLEEQGEGKYILTLILDEEWLKADGRVYPVTIDPSITTSRYYQDIEDTYIYYGDTGNYTKGEAHIIRIGNSKWLGPTGGINGLGEPVRGLIKFNLPSLSAGDQVIYAGLNIWSYPKTSEWTPPTRQMQLDVHKMTADWSEDKNSPIYLFWDSSCNNIDTRITDYVLYQYNSGTPTTSYRQEFDITSIAKDWYTTGNNYGVMIKEHNEIWNYTAESDMYFISSDTSSTYYERRPVAQIIYRNQTGLENYLSYHTQDVGRAGTVYTNDYNGNVTWIHEDLSTPGQRMPVSIRHVYNTNDRKENINYGYGVRLNISQTIELDNIGGVDYAKYIDEDGTRHYFEKQAGTNIYQDEDGLGLTLTLANNQFTMEDKGGNKSRFELRIVNGNQLWHLKEIENEAGDKITITFSPYVPNDFCIWSVTDVTGQKITFQYNNGGTIISGMTDPSGRQITYNYNIVGGIDSITYPDGRTTWYDFSDNMLYGLVNIDGYNVRYDYNLAGTRRVKSIKEQSSTNELGNSLNITYGSNVTIFTDNKGYTNNVNFNNFGQATGVVDLGKTPNSIIGAYGKNYEYGTLGGSKNKLTLESKLVQSPVSLIYNGSAEYDGKWSSMNWGNNQGTNTITTEEAYTGKRSFKVTSTTTQTSVVPFWQQQTSVQRGKQYTITAKVKTNNIVSTLNLGAMIIAYYTASDGSTAVIQSNRINGTNDWQDISLTLDYPANAIGPLYIGVGLEHCFGTAYFDDVQLKTESIQTSYNLIENSGFEDANSGWTSWIGSNLAANPDGCVIAGDGFNHLMKLTGETNKNKLIYQDVMISGKKGDVFTYSAWIKVRAVPSKNGAGTTMPVDVVSTTGQDNWIGKGINTDTEEWQYVSYQFVAPQDYSKIQVYICYYQNANEMYIDNVSLIKDESGNSYTYDTNGNLVNSQDSAKQQSTFNYDGNNNLIKQTNPKGGSFTYTYDTTYKHRLTNAVSSTGVAYNFTYNSLGDATSAKITGTGTSDYIQSDVSYTANDKYLATATDETGNTTTYNYNNITGTLGSITDANGKTTNYVYDNLDRVTEVNSTAGTSTYKNSYTYLNDRLNTIIHNNTTYTFVYDNFGNQKQVKVGDQALITNNYEANNGNLTNSAYGNGQQVSYTYDRFNRVTRTTKSTGTVDYIYDARGNLYQTKDSGLNETTAATYDLIDRPTTVSNTNGLNIGYKYDANSNLSNISYSLNGVLNTSTYNFDSSNRITSVVAGPATITTAYDGLSRITNKTLTANSKTYATTFGYQNTATANRTTTQLASMTNGSEQLSYTYDKVGNIQAISRAGTQIAKYYYDELGQLIREDNKDLDKTVTYTYDVGGNLITKMEDAYTNGNLGSATNTINYSYRKFELEGPANEL